MTTRPMKVVLAFSGGLDTPIIPKRLQRAKRERLPLSAKNLRDRRSPDVRNRPWSERPTFAFARLEPN